MVVLAQGSRMGLSDLPARYRRDADERQDVPSQVSVQGILPLKEAVEETERKLLYNAREKYRTTREMAAALGVNQSTISRKLEKLFPDEKNF